MPKELSPKILVVGLGGIGGIVSAHALRNGFDVTGVTSNLTILNQLQTHGYRVSENEKEWTVKGQVFDQCPPELKFDYIFLATQPTQVEEAASTVVHLLKKDGVFVCFQNGLIEARLAKTYGEKRLVGGIVSWGASSTAPGVYLRTAFGGFTIGRLNGRIDDSVRGLLPILETIGPIKITENLPGARWSKLAINCAVSSLGTISGQNLGALLRHREARRLALEIMSETVEVARTEKIKLSKLVGTIDLDWLVLTAQDSKGFFKWNLAMKHLMLMLVGLKYRRLRSSMLYAIEKGREPAVDFLNGEVVQRGKQGNVATPVNKATAEMIHQIAGKEKFSSMESLIELYRNTRKPAKS